MNNLTRVMIAVERSTQESKANSSHPSSQRGTSLYGIVAPLFGAFIVRIVGAISLVQRNSVPSPHMRCIITASRRASATMAFSPSTLGNVHRPCLQPRPFLHAWSADMTCVPHRAALMASSPQRDPSQRDGSRRTGLRTGVSPRDGPTAFEFLKRAGTSTVLIKAKDTTGPTPGMVINR